MPTRVSYGDWLRARDDEELHALFAARPELITPVPADLTALAARATAPAAVSRALDRVDRLCLAVIEALLLLPEPASYDGLADVLRAESAAPGTPGRPTTAEHPEPARGLGPDPEPGTGRATDHGTTSAPPDAPVRAAVDRLRSLGLVWSTDDALRVAPGVRHALPHPAGLGPPVRDLLAGASAARLTRLAAGLSATAGGAGSPHPPGVPDAADTPDTQDVAASADTAGTPDTADAPDAPDSRDTAPAPDSPEALAARLTDPDTLDRLIRDAGDEAADALRKLTWGPPAGRVGDAHRDVRIDTATSPVDRLLARGLLYARDDRTVVLPREVGLHLRGGRLFRDLSLTPPPLTGPSRDTTLVDRTAGGQALTVVRAVEELLERWGVDPPGVLRSGGLGVRDLRATAATLDVEEWVAVLLAEGAYAAGLLARTDQGAGEWLPTKSYDIWRLRGTEQRWYELVSSWLETDRVPGLAGERDGRERLINALSDEAIRGSAPQVRRAALRALAAAPAGTPPGEDAVRAYLKWQEPRRGGPHRDRMIGWALREAEMLGVTGLGALSAHGRALLADTDPDASGGISGPDPASELARVLPEPVDRIHLQGDLTAIAPGPLVADLARELALAADVESTGGATVYRFTPASVRRALDAGRGAADLHDLLDRHATAEVPQPLRYLIDDVARRHGHLRVGSASAYVRCDDPATLDEILAHRRAGVLRVFRLAPTVMAARSSRNELLDALRAMGYAPSAEAPDGALVITRPDARRADPVTRMHAVGPPPAPNAIGVAAAVRALRAGDEAARLAAPDGEPPRSPAMATIDRLRTAAGRGARVWIGYLDQQGRASSRIVEPARVEGGFLTAYDATRAAIHRFALHRITGVAELDDSGT